MATTTPHLGLTLPAGTDYVSRQALNDNFSAIDTVIGEGEFSHNRKADTTIGTNSVAMGSENVEASGENSFAEGSWTEAKGFASHAEGQYTEANGRQSHAEGFHTDAYSFASHAEGSYTIARGGCSHAAGMYNKENLFTFPEWVAGTHYTRGCLVKITNGNNVSYAICKTENSDTTFDWSKWATATPSTIGSAYGLYIEMIGNGFGVADRSNARSLDWAGNEYLAGDLYVHCGYDGTGGTKVATTDDLPDIGTDAEFEAMINDYYGGGGT